MKILSLPISGALALALLGSCTSTNQAQQEGAASAVSPADRATALGAQQAGSTVSGQAQTQNGITLTPYNDSPDFPNAQMRATSPANGATFASGEIPFSYELTNFQLTKMTGGDHAMEMANSMKGQHIHLIIDDQPYIAKYDTKFSQPIPDGQHVVLSFLSRSYHESLKHIGAYDLRTITVGKLPAGTPPLAFDPRSPSLFYSRPKDTYAGKDAQKIMLDFYLVNVNLAPDGNKVRATINGTPFLLDTWLPYMIEGLPAGTATIKLELLDNAGAVVPGVYNTVERTITVQP